MTFLFLYTELAGYFLSCVDVFAQKYNAQVHIVKWPLNKEAPFKFSVSSEIKVYERNKYDEKSLALLVNQISPDVIYCSGWMDKAYLSICKKYNKQIPVIVGFDTWWKGSLKQQMGVLMRNFTFKKYFSHCWIPGRPQLEFAKKIGFTASNTITGFYSCDYDFFHRMHLENDSVKKNKFPHRFIYVGRYHSSKGVEDLWNAFVSLAPDEVKDWELWCMGTGDIPPIKHAAIKHFGFVQPTDMPQLISQTGVFVLPSRFEPWGVVVHEFASAGFPLICSDKVGAAAEFLKANENGFVFHSKNVNELKEILKKIISMSDNELFDMGLISSLLAKSITPDKWADTLYSVYHKVSE